MTRNLHIYLSAIVLACSSATFAADNALSGLKLGFGFDQGLGLAASLKNFNGFIGNDGIAVDYKIQTKPFTLDDVPGSTDWYIAVGGYHEWDESGKNNEETGIRVPVGIDWMFADRVDAFLQIAPKFDFRDTEFGVAGAIGIRYQF